MIRYNIWPVHFADDIPRWRVVTFQDEKIVAEYKENKTLIDTILCYIKCYGGYVLAIGTGCSFGVTWKLWLPLLAGTALWAYNIRNCKPSEECCKKGACCNK